MNTENCNDTLLDTELTQIMETTLNLANDYKSDVLLLIKILRNLEAIHREVREELFNPLLPNTRHGLYALLKDIDENGGWPYIERMKLQYICENYLKANENFEKEE